MTTFNFSYSQNKFSFNLKFEFLKRIKFLLCKESQYQHFKITSLNEIANLQLLFCQQVPLINNNNLNSNNNNNINVNTNNDNNNNNNNLNSIDEIVKRILINGEGGNSSHLNLIFGLFLNEIGIKVKLIKTEIYNINNYIHYSNIIDWNDGNQYLVDVGLQTYSCFQPIEICDNYATCAGQNVKFNKNEFRIRRFRDGTFIYEVLLLNNNEVTTKYIEIYQPICHFNKNYHVSYKEIINICNNSSTTISSPLSISLFKLFDKGYYLLENDDFYMVYFNNSKKDKKIQLNNYDNNNNNNNNTTTTTIDNFHTKDNILNKYFNIKI